VEEEKLCLKASKTHSFFPPFCIPQKKGGRKGGNQEREIGVVCFSAWGGGRCLERETQQQQLNSIKERDVHRVEENDKQKPALCIVLTTAFKGGGKRGKRKGGACHGFFTGWEGRKGRKTKERKGKGLPEPTTSCTGAGEGEGVKKNVIRIVVCRKPPPGGKAEKKGGRGDGTGKDLLAIKSL